MAKLNDQKNQIEKLNSHKKEKSIPDSKQLTPFEDNNTFQLKVENESMKRKLNRL